jgi:hypothetical protein
MLMQACEKPATSKLVVEHSTKKMFAVAKHIGVVCFMLLDHYSPLFVRPVCMHWFVIEHPAPLHIAILLCAVKHKKSMPIPDLPCYARLTLLEAVKNAGSYSFLAQSVS